MNFSGLTVDQMYSPLDWGNVHRYMLLAGNDKIYIDVPFRIFSMTQSSMYDVEIVGGHDTTAAAADDGLELLGFVAHSDQKYIGVSCGGLWVFIAGPAATLNYNAWRLDDPVKVIVNPRQ